MKILIRSIAFLGALFIIVTTALTLFFQTEYGKKQIKQYITKNYGEGELSISFEKVRGALPFQWVITNAHIRISPSQTFFFEEVTIRPYFWRLLKKELAFHEIKAQGGSYIDEDPTPSLKSISPDIPLTIYVKKFNLERMDVRIGEKERYQFDAKGSFRITKGGKNTNIDLTIQNKKDKESSFTIEFQGSKNGPASLQVESGIQIGELYPALQMKGLGSFSGSFTGSWEAFNELLTTREKKYPIRGVLSGDLYYLQKKDWYLSFPLKVQSNLLLYSDLSMEILQSQLNSSLINLTFSGQFAKQFEFQDATFRGQIQPSLIQFWDGPIYAQGDLVKKGQYIDYAATMDSPIGKLWRWPFEHFTTEIKGRYADKIVSGTVESYLDVYAREWKGNVLYSMDISQKTLFIEDLHFYSPFSEIVGSARAENWNLWSNLDISIGDLSQIQPFFPNIKAFGSVKGSLALYPEGGKQSAIMDLSFFDTIFYGVHTQNALLTLQANDLYSKPLFDLIVQAKESRYRGLQLDSFSVTTTIGKEAWPYSIALKGKQENPIDFLSSGNWKKEKNRYIWNIEKLEGFFFDQAFTLQSPVEMESKEDFFRISPFVLQMPDNQIEGEFLLSQAETQCELHSTLFPLSLLSLNPWNLSFAGAASVDLQLSQKKDRPLDMDFQCEIYDVSMSDAADLNPVYGKGKISSSYHTKKFSLDSDIQIREEEKFSLFLRLPLEIEGYPWRISYPRYGNLLGSLAFDAKIEDVLDYINIGPHRLEGEFACDVEIGGTWRKPSFKGKALFQDGKYDNYYTGTSLGNLYASFILHERELRMSQLSGNDGMKGALDGTGSMTLSLDHNFPFEGSLSFQDLQLVDIDLVKAKASGSAEIQGNRKGATATGKIGVTRADFAIPDKISFPVPSLPVTYINQGEKIDSYTPRQKSSYPLELDFSVTAPEDVYISGRGLNSQWKGDFTVGGTYDNILAKGTLELMRGDFLFAGKSFDLTSGLLTFTGESNQPPFLELSGKVEQSGITIITQLRGKLTEPRLTFRSLPPLPLSAILSYLIFGQDISEISPLQAAQLAATAASLSGEGPDILELARKSLGLDRLAVVSTPTKEGVEGAAIQIGKYLAKGLLFSISQGPNPSSGNISVEVDLTHGFIFEAETLQQQEQGKFSLKWHKNY